MTFYPLFVDLYGKNILVAGAGSVGQRKIAGLGSADPRCIMVVDPCLSPERALELKQLAPVDCHARVFAPEDVHGKFLVFAATNDRAMNAEIAALCREQGILCNSADAPDEGNFIVPAHFMNNGITVALSTSGHSPALARILREDLEAFVGKRYTHLLQVLSRLRPLLFNLELPTQENTALFRALAHSPLAGQLECGDRAGAEATLSRLLPEPLLCRVGEILHGY
jgi:precorrin-2 dehydrogenase/sirohydrochlorin ferrochelatase